MPASFASVLISSRRPLKSSSVGACDGAGDTGSLVGETDGETDGNKVGIKEFHLRNAEDGTAAQASAPAAVSSMRWPM
jgi:hypothetical protein